MALMAHVLRSAQNKAKGSGKPRSKQGIQTQRMLGDREARPGIAASSARLCLLRSWALLSPHHLFLTAMPATLRYVQPVSAWPFAAVSRLDAEESQLLCVLLSVLAEGRKTSTGSQVPVPFLKKSLPSEYKPPHTCPCASFLGNNCSLPHQL